MTHGGVGGGGGSSGGGGGWWEDVNLQSVCLKVSRGAALVWRLSVLKDGGGSDSAHAAGMRADSRSARIPEVSASLLTFRRASAQPELGP